MYVYVKYLTDNTTKIVKDSSIKRFDRENIDYKKKYKVRWDNDGKYYDTIIKAIGGKKKIVRKILNIIIKNRFLACFFIKNKLILRYKYLYISVMHIDQKKRFLFLIRLYV